MKLKKLVAGLGMALAFLGASSMAQAQEARFQDDDVDFLLDATGAPKSGTFAPGDILLSVFEIPSFSIGGVNAIPPGFELTGVAGVQIVGFSTLVPGVGTTITLAPIAAGLNSVTPVDVIGGGAGGGATIAMFLNPTGDFDLNIDPAVPGGLATNCTSRLQCLTEAMAGDLIQVDGFAQDPDEFWRAILVDAGGANTAAVLSQSFSSIVATFEAAQTTLFNSFGDVGFLVAETGAACPAGVSGAADTCVEGIHVSGTISGGLGLNDALVADGAFARSDFDANKFLVPEPGVLALVGLGFMGMALTRRRRPQ